MGFARAQPILRGATRILFRADRHHRGLVRGAAGNRAQAGHHGGRPLRAERVDGDLVVGAGDGAVAILRAILADLAELRAGIALRPLRSAGAGRTRQTLWTLRSGRSLRSRDARRSPRAGRARWPGNAGRSLRSRDALSSLWPRRSDDPR